MMASQEQDTGVQGTAVESLPGYLPWEDDLEMVSKYLDRKVAYLLYINYVTVRTGSLMATPTSKKWAWQYFGNIFDSLISKSRKRCRTPTDSTCKSTLL